MSEIDKLRAELHAEIDRRIDAVEQKSADVEPPMLADSLINMWATLSPESVYGIAGRRLRYVEAELARLREGLKRHEDDCGDDYVQTMTSVTNCLRPEVYVSHNLAREIQRHRALVKP